MKKRIVLAVFLAVCLVLAALLLASCDEGETADDPAVGDLPAGGDTSPKQTITGVTFVGAEVTYDGTEHTIEVSGTIPAGVSVSYTNHKATNAGTYDATATLSGEGYETLTLMAKLTVKKAVITGITFEGKSVTENGTEHSILIAGMLPTGVSVEYQDNSGTAQGTYHAVATLSGDNYETLVLYADLKIKPNLLNVAADVIGDVLTVPDVWEFIPESLALDNLGYASAPTTDFSGGFVPVSSIPKRFVGKQMNVVYDALNNTQSMLAALRVAYGSAEAITTLYQSFINQNPNDYAEYTDTTGSVRFKITLDGGDYKLLLDIGTADLELSYNTETGVCCGRIQLTDSNVLKYEMGEDYLKVSCSILGLSLHQLEFARENDTVVGTLYEYLGTEGTNLKTSAMIVIDECCTSIISNKRESDDLAVNGAVEIYSNETGELIGMHVKESGTGDKSYDTKWFALTAFTGFESVKMVAEQNVLNSHTVYINGNSNSIKTKTVSWVDLSRRFDIEMKTVYIYVWDAAKESYEKREIEIPMLFIQSEYVESFGADFFEKNEGRGVTATPVMKLSTLFASYVAESYVELLPAYVDMKELMPYADIVAYIGQKDAFFEE